MSDADVLLRDYNRVRAALVKAEDERDAAVARAEHWAARAESAWSRCDELFVQVMTEKGRAERAEADADRLAASLRRLAQTPVTADPKAYPIEQWQCDVGLVRLTLNVHDALVAERDQ